MSSCKSCRNILLVREKGERRLYRFWCNKLSLKPVDVGGVYWTLEWVSGTTGSASDQQSTNDRKVAGSRPTKVHIVCITVLTGNRMGWTARCGRPPLLRLSCRKLEFRLSALMDSDLAWVNGKSSRQSWRYADAFQRSIISEAIYHFYFKNNCRITHGKYNPSRCDHVSDYMYM